MAKYSIALASVPDKVAAVRLVRNVSDIGVADIMGAIGTSTPIAEFETTDVSLEMGLEEGVAHQHKRICDFLASLAELGVVAVITHHAGAIEEAVSMEELKNLFESEILHLAQEHD